MFVYLSVCLCMYVCMYVCMYICVCEYICSLSVCRDPGGWVMYPQGHTYVCMHVHMDVPKLEMVSSSSPPHICNLYLCTYVCVCMFARTYVGTPEGGLHMCVCTDIPLRTPVCM